MIAAAQTIPKRLATSEHECTKLRGYAVQHSMCVVLANFGGPTGGLPAAGGSAIWSETGELLGQLGDGPGVVVARGGQ